MVESDVFAQFFIESFANRPLALIVLDPNCVAEVLTFEERKAALRSWEY